MFRIWVDLNAGFLFWLGLHNFLDQIFGCSWWSYFWWHLAKMNSWTLDYSFSSILLLDLSLFCYPFGAWVSLNWRCFWTNLVPQKLALYVWRLDPFLFKAWSGKWVLIQWCPESVRANNASRFGLVVFGEGIFAFLCQLRSHLLNHSGNLRFRFGIGSNRMPVSSYSRWDIFPPESNTA